VTVDAIRELLDQLERIGAAAPGDDELTDVRNFLVGVFPLRFETTSGIAAALEPLAIYDLPDDYWHAYRSHLEAVSGQDVLEAARELVRPSEALILLTGDADRVRAELEAAEFGPLEVIPAA
jgi:predicted Zn-dependent peptidase